MIFRYDDGTVFEGEWEDAPGYGVQTIAFEDPIDGFTFRHQGHYYRRDEDGDVVGMGYDSMVKFFVDSGQLKVGTMMSKRKWDVTYQRAKDDVKEMKK